MDYRELLKKYLRCIGDAEGYLYINYGDFTPEEEKELENLANESLGQRKRCHCSAGPGWCRCE